MGVVTRKMREGKARDFSRALPVVLVLMLGFTIFGSICIFTVSRQNRVLIEEHRTLASYGTYTVLGYGQHTEENPSYMLSFTVREKDRLDMMLALASSGGASSTVSEKHAFIEDGEKYITFSTAVTDSESLGFCITALTGIATDLSYSLTRPNGEQSKIDALESAYEDAILQANEILGLSGSDEFSMGGFECRSLEYDSATGTTTAVLAVTFRRRDVQ